MDAWGGGGDFPFNPSDMEVISEFGYTNQSCDGLTAAGRKYYLDLMIRQEFIQN